MPKYQLEVGSTLDLVLHRLALAKGVDESTIIRNAIATYAALQKYPRIYVELPATDGSAPGTGLRELALP